MRRKISQFNYNSLQEVALISCNVVGIWRLAVDC